ncbi:MAG: 16S rRNA (uracil(1498)-N(3))-methyltransferase [Acidimicrobiia bacterium]
MKHVPHLVIAAPWDGVEIDLNVVQWRHVNKVLRLKRGDQVTYTDGLGTVGEGLLSDHSVRRGGESTRGRASELVVAVAPPSNKDRQRFLVEKLSELGVSRLRWLTTEHGKDRVANPAKIFSWVLAAVEQSRGAWLMETDADLVSWPDLDGPVVVCEPGGKTMVERPRTVVIGPEGGFGDAEVPQDIERWDLGPNVLRVETAAMVAAARLIG